ncbi:SAICAR synthetase [Patellaria atrata CBS 101060]|uniref:Phosphoribosylaminoimidazole-succinocarboxamide synthase n=1 Tax=Patellaria atrata CBS 101060 TaxID=1346257 RepID=A0A9P4SI63_9PEZI|nr:SAICAR synthetase [Patellaria atrata CBS 101060]
MASQDAVIASDVQGLLPLLARGKVRDVYTIDDSTILFVATDRISAYDVIMRNAIPNKGTLLTALSAHWFTILPALIPSLQTHFITLKLPATLRKSLSPNLLSQLTYRSMTVRKLKIFPIEAIVRGYITGSAWSEYQKKGTVHGIQIPGDKLVESQAFAKPLYTPSTKAEQGEHDENIHPQRAAGIVGEKYAKQIEDLSVEIYTKARDYALARGIIIADTKFEFGLDEETDTVVLVDEVLTPDSSRFWPADKYEVGRAQESFDKQYIRDYLTREGLKGEEGVVVPEGIVKATSDKYAEAFEKLVGKKWSKVVSVQI